MWEGLVITQAGNGSGFNKEVRNECQSWVALLVMFRSGGGEGVLPTAVDWQLKTTWTSSH